MGQRSIEPADYDGVYEMARANLPHGWARIVLLVLALPIIVHFQGWAWGGGWIAWALSVEAARNLLVGRIRPGDPAWRNIYVPVCIITPWNWIAFATILWFGDLEGARVAALCSLFGTLIYVAVNCHQDRRMLTILFAQPCAALLAFILIWNLSLVPLWLALLATFSATAMLASLAVGAAFMYAGRMQLLAARNDLQAERDALDEKVRARTAELEEAMQAAQAASEAKSRFLATMSHELRTPLNAIINYAELLDEDLGERRLDAEREDARRIKRAGESLLGLINDVLEAAESSRIDLVWEEADIAGLIRETVEAVRAEAERNGNHIAAKIAPDVGVALTSPERLRQALTKLASNACKFTQNGLVSIAASVEDERLVVRVRDTGVGMSEDELRRIFQPFVQVDDSDTRRAGGSGLGLVITRSIARLMGGDVTAESAPGAGSTFTLRVPIRRPTKSAATQAA